MSIFILVLVLKATHADQTRTKTKNLNICLSRFNSKTWFQNLKTRAT